MANTIKLGAGNWATKENEILAYNDENNNFKPLPFDTTRATTATRVNKDGLIENIAASVPRVDYASGDGALLLEPASTNLVTQSEAFGNSYWTKSGVTIQGDASTAGVEEVVNGDFATDSDWNKGGIWTISDGVANCSSTVANLDQGSVVEIGKKYTVTLDIVSTNGGNISIYLGSNVSYNQPTEVGTLTFTGFQQGASTSFVVRNSSFIGSIDNISVKEVSGFSAPSVDSPLGAFKLVEDTSTGQHQIYSSGIGVTALSDYSYSIKFKTNGSQWVAIGNNVGEIAYFDLVNGVLGTSTMNNAKITSLANGYYDCQASFDEDNASDNLRIYLADADNSLSYTGDGTSGVYIFGAQLEQKSYATSYIPTNGSQISRLSESASQTLPDGIINSSEGVLYFEGSALYNDNTFRLLSISDGTSNNEVKIQFSTTDNRIGAGISVGGVSQCDIFKDSIDIFSINKVAFSYSLNKFELWVNGVKEAEDLSGSVFSLNTLNKLSFSRGNDTLNFISNTKDLRVYDQILTDAELVKLTTI